MTSAKYLRDFIKCNCRVEAQLADDEVLFNLALGNGRRQGVLVSLTDHSDCQVIEVKSRCCVADRASVIRAALRRNLSIPLGGFSLDTSTKPNTIDLVQRLVVLRDGRPNLDEFLATVLAVAVQADQIEQQRSVDDVF